MEVFEVIHPGALTTIQDLGRYGYQRYGVPVSGAMDKFSLRVANLLAGNRGNDPALEITVQGPTLRTLAPARVAFAGGDLSPKINGEPCLMWCSLPIKEGDVISFGAPRNGCRAYIGIYGGISVPFILGSYATHHRLGLGGFGRPLIKGDVIRVTNAGTSFRGSGACQPLAKEDIPIYTKESIIRVILGPQQEHFTNAGIKIFLESDYVITPESDRMGYRLRGPKVEHRLSPDVITDATPARDPFKFQEMG